MQDNQNAMQNQSAQSSSPINWNRLEALMASVWEQSKETSAQMKETDKQLKESRKEYDKQLKESRKEYDKQLKESRKEYDRRMEESRKEHDRLWQKTNRHLDKMSKQVAESTKNIKENEKHISKQFDQFFSQSGHIVEGLMEPSAFRTLRDSGFDVTQCCREMEGSDPKSGKSMEVDLFYMNTVEAIAVEVKTYCTKAKINHFLKQMANFKTIFHKYADMNVYVAMAAIKFTKEALEYAQENGVLIIRAKDNLFSIAPFGKENLKAF